MRFMLLGGSFRQGKSVYRRGDVVESTSDLVTQFKGVFERVPDNASGNGSGMPVEAPKAPAPVNTPETVAKPPAGIVAPRIVHKGGGRYDVVHGTTGEKINRRVLTKAQATELASSLAVGAIQEDGG